MEATMTTRFDLMFLFLAALCMIAGVFLGMWMGSQQDHTLGPVHAHLNLLGWVSLAIYGLAYRAWPELADSRLAAAHFVLAAPTAVAFPVAVGFSIHGQPLGTIITAPIWFLSTMVFAVNVGRAAFGRRAVLA
jgi:drug/metabolite transporter superfamily protein YnfA